MQITEVKLVENRNFFLFKGQPKTGKSIAAASFPGVYFLDMDGRIKSVASYYRGKKDDIHFDQFKKLTGPNGVEAKLNELLGFCPYDTICFDGLTSTARQLMKQMLLWRQSEGKAKMEMGGIKLAQIEDYMGQQAGLIQIMDGLIELSKKHYVILTAHVIETQQKKREGGVTISRSLLAGSKAIAAEIPIYFNEVYHFYVNDSIDPTSPPERSAVTTSSGIDWASTTMGLPEEIPWTNRDREPPFFFDIIMKRAKEYEASTEPPITKEEPEGSEDA